MPIPLTDCKVVMTPQVAQRLKEIAAMEVVLPRQDQVDEYTTRALLALALVNCSRKEIKELPLPRSALR